MQPPYLKKWKFSEKLVGLLFFAQSLNELLFDYSLDSYKAPALNLHSSALELNYLMYKHTNSEIKKESTQFAISEFCERLNNDFILNINTKNRILNYTNTLKDNIENATKCYTITQLIIKEFADNSYWESIKSSLVDTIRNPKEKYKIYELAKIFATELDQLRISRRYTFKRAMKFFFSNIAKPRTIYNSNQIKAFIDHFDKLKYQDYTVIFKGSGGFKDILKHTLPFSLNISGEKFHDIPDKDRFSEFCTKTRKFPYYIIANEIRSKDPHSARKQALESLEFTLDIVRFHMHNADLCIADCSYIISENDFSVLLDNPPRPMQRGFLYKSTESVDHYMRTLKLIYTGSFDDSSVHSFIKALDFHHAAIQSNSEENQLIDLWAALEGFLPIPHSGSRISDFLQYMIPALSFLYIDRIFSNLAEDLDYCSTPVRKFIQEIDTSKSFKRNTIELICSDGLKDKREILYGMLNKNPLLRHRCYTVHEDNKNGKSILSTIENHERRISLHIRRIYTLRNQLMHNAQSLPYLSHLVENLHDYLDTIIYAVSIVGSKDRHIDNIQSALELISNHSQTHKSYLRENSRTSCDASNIMTMIYGPDHPASIP